MDTNLSQTLRQLKILQLINQRKLLSQCQLTDHFQVHPRTINRDLAALMGKTSIRAAKSSKSSKK